MHAPRKPLGALSDDELAQRTRATATLLAAAARTDSNDPIGGYRDLLRELLLAAEQAHGVPATLALIVDELVRALNDPAQVDALIAALVARRERR